MPPIEDFTEVESYMEHAVSRVSENKFQRHDTSDGISAETVPENSSILDFKSFAQEYPEKIAHYLQYLRPDFQEMFVEFWVLEKSQSFIGQTHGQIQTRVWQQLRIIERAIGSMILLGTEPPADILRPILVKAGLETTEFGSLTDMIVDYAASRNYTTVAKKFHVPVPTIRKVFRPIIKKLATDKNVEAVAVGAYLRSLTHQASLTKAGLGKRWAARLRRVKVRRFDAPPSDNSPIMEFGHVDGLHDTPWNMLEISPTYKMNQIYAALRTQGKRIFGKNVAQIFAPVNDDGDLAFGYIFARCKRQSLIRALTRVRGISELSVICDDEGNYIRAVTVPHEDVRGMMAQYETPEVPVVQIHDFVEILTGPAEKYCGTVISLNVFTDALTIEVSFPTGKKFLVNADASCVKLLPNLPKDQRKFWGTRLG